jgi:hypothetical protein
LKATRSVRPHPKRIALRASWDDPHPGWQPDPAGTGKDIGAYLTGQAIGDAVSKVTTAHERCIRAEREADAGRLDAAHEAYSRVFGSYYPAT